MHERVPLLSKSIHVTSLVHFIFLGMENMCCADGGAAYCTQYIRNFIVSMRDVFYVCMDFFAADTACTQIYLHGAPSPVSQLATRTADGATQPTHK